MAIQQSTNLVLMISPDTFQYNVQTANTNSFQHLPVDESSLNSKVMEEFESMVATLKANDIQVITLASPKGKLTPDAVFPNNWFSTHPNVNGTTDIVLYPMLAESRRLERQLNELLHELKHHKVNVDNVIDLTQHENESKVLEGTGSLVLDRVNKIAYASLSLRTDKEVLQKFIDKMGYTSILFHSHDSKGQPIYHTNVVMSIGTEFAVISAESIINPGEKEAVLSSLKKTGKEIINISAHQMTRMAANILEVRAKDGAIKIIMSQTAYDAFTPRQLQELEQYGDLVIVDIEHIEKIGGGSARCMLAEIFH